MRQPRDDGPFSDFTREILKNALARPTPETCWRRRGAGTARSPTPCYISMWNTLYNGPVSWLEVACRNFWECRRNEMREPQDDGPLQVTTAYFILQNVRDWRLAMDQQNDGATVQSTTDQHDRVNSFHWPVLTRRSRPVRWRCPRPDHLLKGRAGTLVHSGRQLHLAAADDSWNAFKLHPHKSEACCYSCAANRLCGRFEIRRWSSTSCDVSLCHGEQAPPGRAVHRPLVLHGQGRRVHCDR